MTTHELCRQWLELSDDKLTVDNVHNILENITQEEWVAAAVANKVVDDVIVQRTLLTVGIEKTSPAVERSRQAIAIESTAGGKLGETQIDQRQRLAVHFATHPADELLCRLRALLLQRLDKLETYIEMFTSYQTNAHDAIGSEEKDEWDDMDAWEEKADIQTNDSTRPILALSAFMRQPLLTSAMCLASHVSFIQLLILFKRHSKILTAHQLAILDSIPDHVHPSQFHALLPTVDGDTESSVIYDPWRFSPDWTESEECISALTNPPFIETASVPEKYSVLGVAQWYRKRIHQADDSGFVDIALALVQHGASLGIMELDELGEDLSLLYRLVYDTPKSIEDVDDDADDWSLSRWASLNPPEVLQAYLAHSTPKSVPNDIKRLVMPYLYVLEARAERAGKSDSGIVNRLLYEYILQAPLDFVASIFSASKPILPFSERIIKSDEDMVRLALSYLYGNNFLDEWQTMSQLFECLPEWCDVNGEEADEADTTLTSLGDFVAPKASKSPCTPQDLFIFFSPLTASALSRLLDVLDVHLESGEILSRWDLPAPLRWFLQSADDEKEQRAWATRMSRRAGGQGGEPENETEWLELLEDMLKLTGSREGPLRGAFGLLSREEVSRIFFGGLLSSGNFRVAKDVIRKSKIPCLSDSHIIEEQVLAASRELYDNASSGNLHQGDMKLAYECLNVAKPSPAIKRERDFIEATSRIYSFNVTSHDAPISPIEIRLEKDKLNLVLRVISSTHDAYKHSGVILELAHKLGYQDNVAAEVRVHTMLAEAALQAEDFTRAAETVNRMLEIVGQIPQDDKTGALGTSKDLCWRSCFQLGRQTEFEDTESKLRLLGCAVELCPPEHLVNVLNVWQRTEGESIPDRKKILAASKQQTVASRKRMVPTGTSSTAAAIRARLQELSLNTTAGISAPDAAALASRAFKGVAANFPFSMRSARQQQAEDSPEGYRHEQHSDQHVLAGADVSVHAKQAFARGIGWLIGADEE